MGGHSLGGNWFI